MSRLTKRTKYGYEDIEEGAITSCSNKLGPLEKIEEEYGIDLITFHKALRDGIWSREHLHYPNKYSRQTRPFDVKPIFWDGEWWFEFNPRSWGSGDQYGPAHIFWDRVKIKDEGVTWSLNKSAVNGEELE